MKGYLASASDQYITPGAWAARGRCLSAAPMDDQVPSGNGFKPNAGAVLLCVRCPVKDECLAWAMQHTEEPCPGQVLGSLYSYERRRLRAQCG